MGLNLLPLQRATLYQLNNAQANFQNLEANWDQHCFQVAAIYSKNQL